MQKIFRCSAMCAAVLTLGHAVAQTPSSPSSLREITVTGNPLGATDLITPAASLSGAALLLRRGTTLGETLDGTPGVSATWFGALREPPGHPRAGWEPHPSWAMEAPALTHRA